METQRDRYARETQLRLDSLTVSTPQFGVLTRGRDEFELFIRMRKNFQLDRVSACIIRLFDVASTILPRIREEQQTTINGGVFGEDFRSVRKSTLILVDPATEYLFYESNLSKFTSSAVIPEPFREYARRCESKKKSQSSDEYLKWKDANHRMFWGETYNDPKKRIQVVGETLDLELRSGANVTMAPVPIKNSSTSFGISTKMNEVMRELSRDKAAQSSTYFLIHKSALNDERLMDEITSYIEKDDARLTILKFKQLDLTESARVSEREAYREFLLNLALIRQKKPSRGFTLLEGENQTFPSATVAFDLVSTSFTGQDGDGSGGRTPYGKWYDPKEMTQRDFQQVQRIVRTTGILPHGCPFCRSASNLSSITPQEWYAGRRIHYCHCMQEFMEMIARAIKERNVELAREKIVNSSMSVLKTLIPRA